MMQGRPTPAQERWLTLADRYPACRQAAQVTAGMGGWHATGFLTRCGLFVLGLIAVAAATGLFFLMFGEHAFIPAGLVLWLAGELLMREGRWVASGLEEVLVLAGLVLLAFGVLDVWQGSRLFGDGIALGWAMAGAFLLAGLRLLNPLFTTVAVLVAAQALSYQLHQGSFGLTEGHRANLWTAWLCYALAVLALILGGRRWQRPSHDRMLDWLVVVLPLAGYLSLVSRVFVWDVWQWEGPPSWVAVAALSGFAVAAVLTALHRRTHAPLLAAMGCCIGLGYELRHLTGMPLYGRLITWGLLLLLGSFLLERHLRVPRAGITSRRLSDQDDVFNMAETAGAAVTAPGSAASVSPGAAPSTVQGQGGQFGGGGSSGSY